MHMLRSLLSFKLYLDPSFRFSYKRRNRLKVAKSRAKSKGLPVNDVGKDDADEGSPPAKKTRREKDDNSADSVAAHDKPGVASRQDKSTLARDPILE